MHGSLKGRKIDILRKNQKVCFEFDINTEIVEAENACEWGMKYQSVIGFGKASFIEDPGEKGKALDVIMNQYTDRKFLFPERQIKRTAVIKIEIERIPKPRPITLSTLHLFFLYQKLIQY